MKRNCKYLMLLVIWAFSACSRIETEPGEPEEAQLELQAVLESGEQTRTHFDGQVEGIYYPYWSGTEQIAVYSEGSSCPVCFTFVSGENTRQATFSGPGTSGRHWAFYPFESAGTLEDGAITMTLPAEQTYSPGSIGEGAFPMLAVSDSQTLQFRNLCSVLKISLTGNSTVYSITFAANDAQTSVSGQATVQVDGTGNPVLSLSEGGASSVRLDCLETVLSETVPTDFFLVIPPGTYKGGFTVKIKTSEGTVSRSTQSDVVFERSQIRSIPVFRCEGAEIDLEDIPDNVLLYKSVGERKSEVWSDRQIVSHTYENGWGKIVFDGPLKMVSGFSGDGLGNKLVTEVILPSSVETIYTYAFADAPLKSIRLSENLKKVNSYAFFNCPQLERFEGPHASSDGKGIVLDGELVAYVGAVDEVIKIPEEVRTIRDYLFMELSDEARRKVRELVFPEGLITCGRLFDGNNCYFDNLEYITIPSTYVNTAANYGRFNRCPRLKKFRGSSPYIWDDGNCLVDETGRMFAYAGGDLESYAIPEGVKSMLGYLLEDKVALKRLSFPSTMESIPVPVAAKNLIEFYGPLASEDGTTIIRNGIPVAIVPKLEEYVTPKEITKITFDLFLCSTVRKIILRDNITELGNEVFGWSDVETIIMSKSLRTVGRDCFNTVPHLKELYFRSPVPPSCGGNPSWNNFREDFVTYVPKGSLEAYRNSQDWAFLPRNFQEYEPEDTVVPDWYVSRDYSRDGQVTVLQQATKGNGINLVLMGDAFSDRQINQGTYGKVMEKMEEAFFSVEPYKSYRSLFNVYRVDVVSEVEGYAHPGQRLGTWFGEGTRVGGSMGNCLSYAWEAVGNEGMDNVLVIVAMDTTAYAGTCYMMNAPWYQNDWGEGSSIAYFPLGKTDETLAQLVHHEAGGHGFAKLADEYYYESQGAVTQEKIDETHSLEPYGWWKNIDFTSDPAQVKWSYFLRDDRYRNEGLGVYEGGLTYRTGVWRPTQSSIMMNNTGGFNAPSREAIWYRLHKLAYGENWQYNYEEFVSYDAVNRKMSGSAPSLVPQEALPPLAAPVVIHKSWKEVLDEK